MKTYLTDLMILTPSLVPIIEFLLELLGKLRLESLHYFLGLHFDEQFIEPLFFELFLETILRGG
jgi:hypothetical protein